MKGFKRCHCCQKELSKDMFNSGRDCCRPCRRLKAFNDAKKVIKLEARVAELEKAQSC